MHLRIAGRLHFSAHRQPFKPLELREKDLQQVNAIGLTHEDGPHIHDSFDSDEEDANHIEDEHHMIFDCSGYSYARDLFKDLFSQDIVTVGQFLNQPNHHRLAKFLTWARMIAYEHCLV